MREGHYDEAAEKLEVDHAEIEHDLSIIMIVGEKMKSHIGLTATATKALSDNHINIQMISQGSSEVSIMIVINSEQEKAAIFVVSRIVLIVVANSFREFISL